MTIEDCYKLKYVIYVIFDKHKYNFIYTGQTIQTLEKRISAHLQKMIFLQRYGSFEKNSHISLIAFRMAVYGVENGHVLPWLCFEKFIQPT